MRQDHAADPGTGRRPQALPRLARGRGAGATSGLLGLHWPGIQPPSPCGRCCHHCPLGALHCGPFTTQGARWQCPPRHPSGRAGPDLESHSQDLVIGNHVARHRRGCQGGARLPTHWSPHSPAWTWKPRHHVSRRKDVSVWPRLCQIPGNTQSHGGNAREVQRSQNRGVRESPPNTSAFRPFPAHRTEGWRAELWEGRGRGAVPTPLRLYDSTMPLSPQEAAGCKPSQPCRLQGMTPRRPEGRDTSVPAVPFTRIHTPASLHCCTSVDPPLWSTDCLGRHPIFGAQLTPHTHGHQVPPVRSHDGSFWRRGPRRAVGQSLRAPPEPGTPASLGHAQRPLCFSYRQKRSWSHPQGSHPGPAQQPARQPVLVT